MSEAIVADWQERIRAAAAAKSPLRIRGGGTKDFYGGTIIGEVLNTRSYAGIVDYDPTELVITARAGTALEEIEATMHDAGQMLAFEPPHFGNGGSVPTLGGCIAAGLSGPRRPYCGAARDLVLGVRVIDGSGEDLRFGGRVMKNVAGFDVPRLMTGALGTLGVLLEVSLKCLPAPKMEATRLFECTADEAIRWCNEWGGQPLPLSATCYHRGRLAVRLSGAPAAVRAATARLGGEAVHETDGGAGFWRGIRDHTHPFFAAITAKGVPLWRLSVKSTAPVDDPESDSLIEWGGALRWRTADERADADSLRAWAMQHGGHATLFRGGDNHAGAFDPLSDVMAELHRRLKAVFDPAGIFNRGRLYSAF